MLVGLVIMLVAWGVAGPAAARSPEQPIGAEVQAPHGPTRALVAACFVPADDCVDDIVAVIGAAKHQIRVQAYGFSSPPILRALAAAHARGIDVAVILDKSDAPRPATEEANLDPPRRARHRRHSSGAKAMIRAGVPVWIDDLPTIAHNKLIVIDGHLVIGGSYNYTASAERRNAENVTFIDSPEVAAWFLANWRSRRAVSRRLGPEPTIGAVAGDGSVLANAGCARGCPPQSSRP